MDTLLQDLRFALRSLRSSAGFGLLSVATLALGIGAATAIFSVVYGVLLRPLPYPESERIVRVWEVGVNGGRSNFSGPNFADVAERSRSFTAMAQMSSSVAVSVTGGSEATRAVNTAVSEDFFRVMGVQPVIGRGFSDVEVDGTGATVAVVSHAFWQRYLGGSLNLDSKPVRFDDRVFTVIGVMPAGFDYPANTEMWTPRQRQPREEYRTAHNWGVVGRLAPGVELAAARRELSTLAMELRSNLGDDTDMVNAEVLPLREQLVGRVRPALIVQAGAAGLLLLIAYANVASLLLVRFGRRRQELAIRMAIGAGYGRLLQQFLTEALVLALASGVVGCLLAWWGVDLLLALEPGNLPRADEISVNGPALLFALVASLVTAGALGILPALRIREGGLRIALGQDHRTQAGSRSGSRARGMLVIVQVAMTLVLLTGAGLISRSLLAILAVDPGFRTRDAVVMQLALSSPATSGEAIRQATFRTALLERLRLIPGVTAVGSVNALPLSGGGSSGTFLIQQRPDEITSFEDFARIAKDPARTGYARFRAASDGYFEAMEIPLIRGRLFRAADDLDAPHVAVISKTVAETRWPGVDPIGKLIQFGNMDGDLRPLRVVGVVGDVRGAGLDADPPPIIYVSTRQRIDASSNLSIVMVTPDEPTAVTTAASSVLREMDASLPPRFQTLEDVFASSFAHRRFSLFLLGVFGASALLLTVLGVYGVVSYTVAQRTREMGIRLALGAGGGDVLALVLGGGLALTVVGLALGLIGAWAGTRLLASQLYGVSALDPAALLGSACLLAAASLLAAYLPARRATRVDPTVALRGE